MAITGCGVAGSNSAEFASVEPGQVPGGLDHHALQAEAQPERRDAALAGVPDRADLALDAADPEAAGDQHTVHAGQRGRGARPGSAQSSEGTQRISTLARWANPPARSASVTDR